jgi:imidazoleglycerol phosphate dehydratase HisB
MERAKVKTTIKTEPTIQDIGITLKTLDYLAQNGTDERRSFYRFAHGKLLMDEAQLKTKLRALEVSK